MRHIVCVSGGKDSAALAIFMKKEMGMEIELVFCDTGRELPEVYSFLETLGDKLNQEVKKLSYCGRDFDWYLREFSFFLPSAQSRWCTRLLKIMPLERYIGNKQEVTVYIGIRADEMDREGNYGLKKNVIYQYPLRDNGIKLKDVIHLLNRHNIELPSYYNWRSVGGCWNCMFQRLNDWRGLKKFHPHYFSKCVEDEEKSLSLGRNFTWRMNLKLSNLTGEWIPPSEHEYEDITPCLICAK